MAGIFQKLFGRSEEIDPNLDYQDATQDAPTLPLSPEKTMENNDQEVEISGIPQFVTGCAQSTGMQRDHNEDALFSLSMTLTSDETQTAFGLFIVADGMGGHRHGEIASGLAVRAMADQVTRKLLQPFVSLKAAGQADSIQEILRDGVQEAHRAIKKDAPGGGTTMTAVLIFGNQLNVAHIGDSRAYQVDPDGSLHLLTRDHSLVKRLVELGQITTEEAAVHPQRNVLYRALGQGEPFDADISTSPLPKDGYLLLCSDGLWGVVAEQEISAMIRESESPQKACQKMIEAANRAGGPDNITAILVKLPG